MKPENQTSGEKKIMTNELKYDDCYKRTEMMKDPTPSNTTTPQPTEGKYSFEIKPQSRARFRASLIGWNSQNYPPNENRGLHSARFG
jgi:hypothetical protein